MPTRPTRRDIIRLSGAAAAASLLGNVSFAQTTQHDSFTFAFISDTHLGRNGEEPSAQFKAAVEEINSSPAEFVIHCGDLVNGGENPANEKRYPEWLQLSGQLKKPIYAVPGNHDPEAMFTKHIKKHTDTIIDRTPFRFICFRDAKPNPDHDGIVTAEQIKWLQSHIDDAKAEQRKVILVSHIIFHDNAKPDRGWKITDGREDFAKLLADNHETIAVFFAGHFHFGLRGWSDTHGIHEVVLPSNCWNTDPNYDGAPGYSLKEFRPGYVLVEASAKRMLLTYKPLGAEAVATKELTL